MPAYFSSTTRYYEIKPGASEISIPDCKAGSKIHLVFTNPTTTPVLQSNRYITRATGYIDGNSRSADDGVSVDFLDFESEKLPLDGEIAVENYRKCSLTEFPEIDFEKILNNSSFDDNGRYAQRENIRFQDDNFECTKAGREVGRSKWNFRCLTNKSPITTTEKTATLRYLDDTNKCMVWVIDENWTDGTAEGSKVNQAIVDAFGDAFVNNGDLVRNLFGTEKNTLYTPTAARYEGSEWSFGNYKNLSMMQESAFDDYVNFLIYDFHENGLLGFFYSGDYYSSAQNLKEKFDIDLDTDSISSESPKSIILNSNGGKFLHLNAPYSVSAFAEMKSTVVHEFQHLVQFGVKNGSGNTWFKEMSSMLCEDVLQKQLEIPENDSPKGRTTRFNNGYFSKSIPAWKNDTNDNLLLSYATSYVFGAYLARKYGGPDFIYDICAGTSAVDEDAIMYGIRLRQPGATWESVLRDFSFDLLNGAVLNTPSLKTTRHIKNGYDYEMTGWNIFDDRYKVAPSYNGPVLLKCCEDISKEIYSKGFVLGTYTLADKDYKTAKISLGGASASGVKEYLVVVKQ